MRILSITAQKPNSTGSGVYLTELVRELAGQGYDQAVVAGIYKEETKEDFAELPEGTLFYPVCFRTEELPFDIVGMSDEMPYPSTRYRELTPKMTEQFVRAFLKAVTQAVEEFQPELILCHHLYLLTACVREKFPNLLVYGFCHNTDLRQMQKTSLKKAYIAEQIRRLDRIFALQQDQKEQVEQIYGAEPEKITVVGMGYNSRIFHRIEGKRKDGILRIVYAGKIAEKKGVMSLLRSLDYLTLAPEELQVFLAGGAGNEKEYEAIRKLAQKSPYTVEFLGRLSQDELAKIYNACDVFVLPSFFEGLPLTVVEALACGNRVVLSELPGVRPWLEEAVPGANVRYVKLPTIRNADEPVEEELPDFERRLAGALEESLKDEKKDPADVSRISWKKIAELVIEE